MAQRIDTTPQATLTVRLFGPMECRVDGMVIDTGSRKQRAVLAILALSAGELASVDRISDELWGEEPPDSSRNALQVYVAGLRRALGPAAGRLRTAGPGYILDVPPKD